MANRSETSKISDTSESETTLLDCTLRDGGYYNAWDFSLELIQDYLEAMASIGVDFVELGFRSLKVDGFMGACAYTTDRFIQSLKVPAGLNVAVMVNAAEIVKWSGGIEDALSRLFAPASESPVTLVRFACHYRDFEATLPAARVLHELGYMVAMNLMQAADRTPQELKRVAEAASEYPVDVLYLADSTGSLTPDEGLQSTFGILQESWSGPLGIHAHDNMSQAVHNSVKARRYGVSWIDGTVTGMGRGPGNAQTENLVFALDERNTNTSSTTSLLAAIRKHFRPLQAQYKWGSNPYYYLSGKYGIHPTYIQEMLSDSRYNEEDVLSVIEHLRREGGKSYNPGTLEAARHFFQGEVRGGWKPHTAIGGREVLILGTGPGVKAHRAALEAYIEDHKPYVIALNTLQDIAESSLDARTACHPVRLLADSALHQGYATPLITPASMLPSDVNRALEGKVLYDFGFTVQRDIFEFNETTCTVPALLVAAYALAVATSGSAHRILLAGFDGYGADDPRRHEVDPVFHVYQNTAGARPVLSITPTLYDIPTSSVYALSD